jgi:hypothetical protein
MKALSRDRLVAALRYDPETGAFLRLSGEVAGTLTSNGYREVHVDGRRYYEHRLAWLYIYGRLPQTTIDHINGDRSDNRLSNLREANLFEQARNTKVPKTNTSGIKGVSWDHARKKWYAYINYEGRMISLGRHDALEDAARARSRAEARLFGDFARAA